MDIPFQVQKARSGFGYEVIMSVPVGSAVKKLALPLKSTTWDEALQEGAAAVNDAAEAMEAQRNRRN
ncbi:hypothetical protein OG474_29875 [Kribbella sp. NBC_01505]|uniref:hypothetical protein n=1 Tax=Kribbella sp. NBC_01505 TaxID=2903580 RepID=UPI00386644A0